MQKAFVLAPVPAPVSAKAAAAARLVARDHLLEVVDVVRAHAVDLVALALDVPRHRDVDQHARVGRHEASAQGAARATSAFSL